LLLHFSSNWYKDLIAKDRLEFRFVPECMLQGGTIQDFISAIRSIDTGKRPRESKSVVSVDWKYFTKIIYDLFVLNSYYGNSPEEMEDIISMLSQESSPVWLHIGSPELQAAHAAAVKKWFGSAASGCPVKKWNTRGSKYLPQATRYRRKKIPIGCSPSDLYKPQHQFASVNNKHKGLVSRHNRVSFPANHFSKFELRGSRGGRVEDLYDVLKPESEKGFPVEEKKNVPYLTLWDCVSQNGADEIQHQPYKMSSEEARTIEHDITFFSR